MRTPSKRRPRPQPPRKTTPPADPSLLLVAEWPIPASAALGSAVRLTGIEREIRSKLPWPVRSGLNVENGRAVLAMPKGEDAEFEDASRIVAGIMVGIESLPVLPSEIEDILTVTAHERQKWLKDGRLKSIGTRTVKLRGRARTVTFHVFDPREVEDILDRDLPNIWREEDEQAKAENRRRAAGKAARTRAGKGAAEGPDAPRPSPIETGPRPRLEGWDAFSAEGFLH